MPPRAYVLIFFGWALLAVITPTLIFWSASAKQNTDSLGEATSEMRVSRRMMVSYLEIVQQQTSSEASIAQAPSPSPAPAPAPAPMSVDQTTN